MFKREQRPGAADSTMPLMSMLLIAGIVAVLGGLAVVALMTWRNAAPTVTIAGVLHDVEHPDGGETPGPRTGRP